MAGVNGGGRTAAAAKFAVLVGVVAGGVLLVRLTPLGTYLTLDGVGAAIERLRGSPFAPAIFITIYAAATALAVPGTILTLAGGALFGVFWGSVYNSVAANLGANAAFGVARFLGRDAVERLAGDRLEKLDAATKDHGFHGLLTLRLIPLIPFNALNFGSGLTAISWGAYALATAVGILPGTIVYTNFADALLAGSREASDQALIRVVVAGALLVLLSFLPTILRKMNVTLPGSAALILVGLPLAASQGAAQSATPRAVEGLDVVDHAPLTELLRDVVHPEGVDYRSLADDRGSLDRYLGTLAALAPEALREAPPAAQMALWINAYNACMLRLVIDHYPIEPRGGFFSRITGVFADRPDNSVWQIEDAFTREHCAVAGASRSQDEIEHEILRPMGDPRIHFAINCAARSCPPLAEQAYTADGLVEQLDERVRAFVATGEHFELEVGDPPILRVNRVLDWFEEDFGGEQGVADFFAPYLGPSERSLVEDERLELQFFHYDWTLNDRAVATAGGG